MGEVSIASPSVVLEEVSEAGWEEKLAVLDLSIWDMCMVSE